MKLILIFQNETYRLIVHINLYMIILIHKKTLLVHKIQYTAYIILL